MKNNVKVSSYADAVKRQFDYESQPKVRSNARKRRKTKGRKKNTRRIKLRMKQTIRRF